MTPEDNSRSGTSGLEVVTSRKLSATRESVFEAFRNPSRLALWWGPNGFTNSIEVFEFKPGGRWNIVMHGPDGNDHRNEFRFIEIVPNTRIVFEHLGSMHWYRMTITLSDESGGTRLTWNMQHASKAELDPIREFLSRANGQNFDRLESLLRSAG